jgi:hypothetical protein
MPISAKLTHGRISDLSLVRKICVSGIITMSSFGQVLFGGFLQ